MSISYVQVDPGFVDDKQMHLRLTHFDARDDAPAQHRRHRLIEEVQGFMQSHWTLPSGEYLLRIAPDGQRGLMP
jgi:hypothetical protein